MVNIPTKVLSQHLRESLTGRKVTAAVFMTYTLEPGFFEEEIVSLLAGDTLIQEPKIRLWQLEEALRGAIGPISVYYDQAGLRPEKGKTLDIRYVPVRAKSGVFHPKMVLLLTEPVELESKERPSLICGVLSANLTMSGWWKSVECAHFEKISAGDQCSFRDDLRKFLREVRVLAVRAGGTEGREEHSTRDHEPLDAIYSWLTKEVSEFGTSTTAGRLRTRLVAGTGSLLNFLEETRGDTLEGASLEVISPFLDEDKPTALKALVERFGIRETRVFLPTADDGTANVNDGLYQGVREIDDCFWGSLPAEFLRLGKEKNAAPRGVHAKVYRFLRRKRYEAILVGSHNLSTAAHQAGGNVEASFFIESDNTGAVDWWLTSEARKPTAFKVDLGDEDVNLDAFVPLQVSYDWTTKSLQALWGGKANSPTFRVESAGVAIFTASGLKAGEWTTRSAAEALALERVLTGTTLLEAVLEDGSRGTILVQEYGMSRKPSLVVSWSISDVLEYWSRLTAEQKADFLQDRAGSVPEGLTAEVERALRMDRIDSFFTTFAGIFHGFEMLRKQVLESVGEGKEKQADHLLFGERHDSLPVLVERIITESSAAEAGEDKRLESYLLLLSAQQLVRQLRRRPEPFFETKRADLRRVRQRTKHAAVLAQQLDLGPDGPAFIVWFERHFLKDLHRDQGEQSG